MKTGVKFAALVLAVTCMLPFVGCKKDDRQTSSGALSYEGVVITDCVRLGAYEGLTVTLSSSDADKGEAVWAAVRSGCEILHYPEEAVAYYLSQAEARCRYYAKEHGITEEEAMTALQTSRTEMEADAKRMVADDLIVLAVQADADITLTAEEKERLFDKYVDKYVADFGYDHDYVKKNLSNLIYESMLYDKTTEYLILKNTFVS